MKTWNSILVSLLGLASNLFGTAQMPERLIYQGKEYSLFDTPLETYLAALPKRPEFLEQEGILSSANWRGYVATWEIKEDKLFLVKLEKEFEKSESIIDKARKLVDEDYDDFQVIFRPVKIERIFPKGTKLPLHASWYSGILQLPRGKQLEYIHMGFESIYESERLFRIENGKVEAKATLDRAGADPYRSVGDLRREALSETTAKYAGWLDGRRFTRKLRGSKVVTRGYFTRRKHGDGKIHTNLYVSSSSKTDGIWIPLTNLLEKLPENWERIEVRGQVVKEGGKKRLKMESFRSLAFQEMVHDPKFGERYGDKDDD